MPSKADDTHCRHGHEWTPENTKRLANGSRVCRQCRRDQSARNAQNFKKPNPGFRHYDLNQPKVAR